MEETIEEIVEKLHLLREFVDTHGLEELIARLSKTKDMEMQAFLLSKIKSEFQKLEASFPISDPLFPIVKRSENGLDIGDLIYKDQKIGRFSLSIENLNRNILVVGSTGHGKTSLVYNILNKAADKGIKYLVFDMKKDYKSLGLRKDTVYIDASDLRINPLEAPRDTNEKEWAVHFADIFSDSFSLLIGSRDYLLENTINLFSSWGNDYPPKLSDLLVYINLNGKKNDYFKVIEGRLKSLIYSTSLFDCNIGISFEKMRDKNIIIGIENIGMAEQYFLVSFILSSFYYSNLGSYNNGLFRRLIVIDDAHTVLDSNKEKDYAKGIPILHSIIAKIRELGFGFIFSDQQISSVISSAIQNTNTKFIGRINLYPDLYKILPGNYNIAVDYISRLKKSQFLIFNEDINPFCLFEADKIFMDKVVNPSLFALKKEVDKEFYRFFKADEMSVKEEAFIHEISSNYFLNLTLHFQNLSNIMSKEEFDSIKNRLLKSRVISQVSLDFPSGKTSKFLFINEDNKGKFNKVNGFTEEGFFMNLFKYLVTNQLKSNRINFEEYEEGFLIKGLLKKFILVNYSIESLKRILETKFDSVIFLVKDNISEQDVLAELIRESDEKQLLNIKALKILHYKDFKI
ncbi:MAG: ATP-binding protein [Candidatus Parvarchaeum sp.]